VKRLREAEVAAAVSGYLLALGYAVVPEFPILGRQFDLFGVREADGAAITVECKERDWRRAAAQARVCRAVTGAAYVAMPAACVSDTADAFLRASGLGLLVVTGELEVSERFGPLVSQGAHTPLGDRARQRFANLVSPNSLNA
jgi:hypothetical protein